ncbi:hypothetical protein [Neolewinella sp.]|uniref:hypothetical protein n=1 Tax=Neolewinella sp. TaxID=2993543 RepID=UPI003B5286CD
MRLALLFTATSLLLCTCGPAPEDDGGSAGMNDQEYLMVTGQPYGVWNSYESYPGYRLRFDGDSVQLFNPFTGYEKRLRAYAADTAARFADTLYVTYDGVTDSTLQLVVRSEEGDDVQQQYRITEPLAYRDLSAATADEVYAITLEGTDYMLYVVEVEVERNGQASSMKTVELTAVPPASDPRRADVRVGFPMGFGAGITLPMPVPGERHRPGSGGDRLLVSESPSGQVQAHILRGQENRVEGPVLGYPYPSLVPDSVPTANLLHLLNAGQITVSSPPPEPDSIGIQYVDLNGEGTGRLVTHGELPHIDFEFTDDGRYTLFSGDRVVQRGRWSFSKGRQFIAMRSPSTMFSTARLIEAYGPGTLTFSLPIDVQTKEPRGVRLTSYYTPVVGLRFGL